VNSHDLSTCRTTLLFFTEFFQLSGGTRLPSGTEKRRGSSLECPWCCATSVCPWLCWSLNSVPAAAFQVGIMLCFFSANWDVAMSQYLLIPFLGGWTSIYQLFWGSLGTRVLTHCHINMRTYETWLIRIHAWSKHFCTPRAFKMDVEKYGSEDDFATGYGPTVGFQVKFRRCNVIKVD
jgi:hypothetical protein